MSRSSYDAELGELGATYSSALSRDVTPLKRAIAGAGELSVIGVGSGVLAVA